MRAVTIHIIAWSLSILSGVSACVAQDSLPPRIYKNAIYFELAGIGRYYSVGYERYLYKTGRKAAFVGRLGAEYFPFYTYLADNLGIPVSVHYVHGLRALNYEAGAGVLNYFDFSPSGYSRKEFKKNKELHAAEYSPLIEFSFSPQLGLRYHRKRISARLVFAPIMRRRLLSGKIWIIPWGGIGLSFSF